MTSRKFGQLGSRVTIEEEGDYITVTGHAPRGDPQMQAVKRLRFRRSDCTGANLIQLGITKTFGTKYIEVLGRGQTLGRVNASMCAQTQEAVDYLNDLVRATLPPPNYGLRSPDGRWWWDGSRWQPIPEEGK